MSKTIDDMQILANEAIFLLKEAALEITNQDLSKRIETFLTEIHAKKRDE